MSAEVDDNGHRQLRSYVSRSLQISSTVVIEPAALPDTAIIPAGTLDDTSWLKPAIRRSIATTHSPGSSSAAAAECNARMRPWCRCRFGCMPRRSGRGNSSPSPIRWDICSSVFCSSRPMCRKGSATRCPPCARQRTLCGHSHTIASLVPCAAGFFLSGPHDRAVPGSCSDAARKSRLCPGAGCLGHHIVTSPQTSPASSSKRSAGLSPFESRAPARSIAQCPL